MEFIIFIIILVITYFILKYVFDFNIKKLKKIGEDKQLDEVIKKYPENIEICRACLKKLNNENIKIEEDKNSNTTLYLVMSNKIFIANLKDSYTRIQTIAHECLHSIQSKKLLWFNFIFSNVFIIYFLAICILAILKVLPYKMFFLSILSIFGLIYCVVRMYLENDAMIKAKYLAKAYMEESNISSEKEINDIVNKYEELNDIGIKCINFQLFSTVIIKCIIFCFICIVMRYI